MEKIIEKHGSYAEISSGVLDRMKRRAKEGDFAYCFGSIIDLTEEDNKKFN